MVQLINAQVTPQSYTMQLLHTYLPKSRFSRQYQLLCFTSKVADTKLTPNLDSIKKQTLSDRAKATKFAISWSVESNYLELKWCKKLGSTTKVEQ